MARLLKRVGVVPAGRRSIVWACPWRDGGEAAGLPAEIEHVGADARLCPWREAVLLVWHRHAEMALSGLMVCASSPISTVRGGAPCIIVKLWRPCMWRMMARRAPRVEIDLRWPYSIITGGRWHG